MSRIDSKVGVSVLPLAHAAGRVDMVALPLWIGALKQFFGFSAAVMDASHR